MSNTSPEQHYDVILIGGGVMSATLGTLLHRLQPDWSIALFERLDEVALESSAAWNNAGTGHAGLCELNYTPTGLDGSIDIRKAANINEQFYLSRQLWASLVDDGVLTPTFIRSVPHMSFVQGDGAVSYLEARHRALKTHPLFATMEYSARPERISQWAPLIMEGRSNTIPVAATHSPDGTDVDFGSLTRQLITYLTAEGMSLRCNTDVINTRQEPSGRWIVEAQERSTGAPTRASARFVFIGAGGRALPLLQRSGIPQAKSYGGFPVAGQFLRCTNPTTVERHHAKVYGQATVGAPPMSVPHVDTRFIDGTKHLLFGPYAGFSTAFLKSGSWLDLPRSIHTSNLVPLMGAGATNISLTKYLVKEVLKSEVTKKANVRDYVPSSVSGDWELIRAGQRVQVIKKAPRRGGVLQFGTELITSSDGTIAALLGASPGASTAVGIVLELIQRCFPAQYGQRWQEQLTALVPVQGKSLAQEQVARQTRLRTDSTLKLEGAKP